MSRPGGPDWLVPDNPEHALVLILGSLAAVESELEAALERRDYGAMYRALDRVRSIENFLAATINRHEEALDRRKEPRS